MALAKQPPLFVPIGGLATDIDDKLLPQGRLLELENCYQLRGGEVVKRFGTLALSTALIGGGVLPTAVSCGQHRGALCSMGQGAQALCTWSPTEAKWAVAAGGRRGPISLTLNQVRGSAATPSVAYGSGFYFVTYADQAGTNYLDVVDATSGHNVQSVAIAGTVADRQISFVNGYGVLYYRTATDAKFLAVNASTLVATTTTVAAGALFLPDIRVLNATTVQVIGSTAGNIAAGIDFVPSTTTATQWTLKDSGGANVGVNANPITWFQDFGGSGKIAVATINTGGALVVQWDIPNTGATRQAVTSYTMVAGPVVGTASIVAYTTTNSATGEFVVLYNGTAAPVNMTSRLSGVITAGPIVFRSVTLSSKPWTFGGEYFVAVTYNSTTDAIRFVLRIPTTTTAPTINPPLAQFAVRQGFGAVGNISQVASPVNGQFVVAIDYQQTVSIGGFNPDAFAVSLVTINFLSAGQTTLGCPKEAIGSLFVPGGNLGQFDGQTYGEAGFAYPPTQPTLTPNVAGANTYWYSIVWSRIDAQGKIWRSAPSVVKSVGTNAVIGGGGSVTVAVPTDRTTGWTNIKGEVYRGILNDAVDLRKVGTVANDITVDSVNFVDTTTDATLAGLEPIYTEGGILENDTPPGFVSIAVWDNRLWGISMDDPQALWYTTDFTLHGGLIFNEDALVIDVRDAHGPMRGLEVVDGNLVIVKDDATYVVQGQGPDAAGRGGSYAAAIVANGIGCNNPQAMLSTKDGLIYRANTAKPTFVLLDRGLSLQPLPGAQRYASETIVGAAFVPTLQQAQFYTASGRTLVYDLASQMWSTHTGQAANAATSWNGTPVYFSSSSSAAVVADLTGATYQEASSGGFNQVITFPWLSLNSLKGYERFYRVQVLGELGAGASGNASATIALYKDFNDVTPLVTKALADATTTDAELRYSAKLTAMKVKLTVTDDLAPSAGWKVSGLAVIWGAKQGLKKQTAANRFT